MAAMSWVAIDGQRTVRAQRQGQNSVGDHLGERPEQVLHVEPHPERPVRSARALKLGVHRVRCGKQTRRMRPVPSRAGDPDHVTDLVATDRRRRRPREGEVVLLGRTRPHARRNQPEQALRAVECLIEDRRVVMAADDHLHLIADRVVSRDGSRTMTRSGSVPALRSSARSWLPTLPVGVVTTIMKAPWESGSV